MGDIQAFIQYVKNFTQPITQLAQGRQRAAANGRGGGTHFSNFSKHLKKRPNSQRAKAADVSSDVEFDPCALWL